MVKHRFDPYQDDDGHSELWRWTGNKPQMEQDLRDSLSRRKEDSMEV
jgi:hypothetical protein